jgi:putative heme-binding domain-containing protein
MRFSLRGIIGLLLVLGPFVFLNTTRAEDDAQASQDETIVEAVMRIEGFDLNSSAKGKAAVLRYLKRNSGSERYFELIERFKLPETSSDLVKLVVEKSTENAGVRAAKLLITLGQIDKLKAMIDGKDQTLAAAVVTALGLTRDKKAAAMLSPLVTDPSRELAVRSAAAAAVGRSIPGQKQLLALVVAGKLPEDLNFTVANVLHSSVDEQVREISKKHLKLPALAGAEPLPPVAELVKLSGDAAAGRKLFMTTGTCIKCHQVGIEGKEVGPNLSEIGSKLSPYAFYVAILDPSAGISHNFETYTAILADGTTLTGIKLGQTDESVTLKTAEAIIHKIAVDDIALLKKQKISLMPSGLTKTMRKKDLIDLVEYLQTLKKKDG